MESVKSFVNSRGRALREIFPRTSELTRELTFRLRTRACLVPRRPENRALASVVGSAAEFAVGWHFGSSPEHMVDRVTTVRWMDARLDDAAAPLAPPLLLLGYRDATFRGGAELPTLSSDTVDLLREVKGPLDPPLSPILGFSVSESLAAEFTELLERTAEFIGPPHDAVCNPAFGMVGIIAGADADLIVDGTLVEVKVLGGAEPEIKNEHIWQLLSYAALDWVGETLASVGHDLERVAIWELRRQLRREASLDEVSRRIGGGDWEGARGAVASDGGGTLRFGGEQSGTP
jgi:hypothetical protein